MGLRNRLARSAHGKETLVSERLSTQFANLGLVDLVAMPMRERVAVCGEIRRMSIKPRAGIPAVEVEISDGTAVLTIVFSGRDHIPGIGHNRGLIVTGVAHLEGMRRVMLNPAYQLLPRPGQ